VFCSIAAFDRDHSADFKDLNPSYLLQIVDDQVFRLAVAIFT
jgi:hypothetical protein